MSDFPSVPVAVCLPVIGVWDNVLSLGSETTTWENPVGSGTYPTANKAYFHPVIVPTVYSVANMFTYNGTAVGNSVDVGIYDTEGNRLTSNGGTVQSGTSVMQTFSVTAVTLLPGLYYWAIACNGTTSTFFKTSSGVLANRALGGFEMASAYPLPSTATFAAATTGQVQGVFATSRSFV